MAKLGIADRIFLLNEGTGSPQHVSCLAVFALPARSGPRYLEELAESMAAQRTFVAPFNLQLKRPALKSVKPSLVVVPDDEIDLDFHFSRSALPSPGGERELGVLTSRLHSRALDLSRPLWEAHLIEGLEGDRFALLVKVHHALIDGVGAMRRMQRMLTTDPTDLDVRAVWSVPAPSTGRAGTPVARGAGGALGRAVADGRSISKAAGGMLREAMAPTDDSIATPFKVPRTRLNGRIGQQRRVATQTLDFSRVREVADKVDASVNDVFLALCGGALRRYLDELGELPSESLTAGTPVSIRVGAGDNSNNAFTIAAMKLFSDIADPLERVRACARSGESVKQVMQGFSKSAATTYGAMLTLPHHLQNLVGIGGRVAPPYNLIVSNVPGPVDKQYMAGAAVERLTPFGVIYHGVGLMIIAVTASGMMSIGLCGDRDSLPHLQRLAVYLGEEFDAMEKALSGTTSKRTRSGAKPKS